jgi:hypothetical protein
MGDIRFKYNIRYYIDHLPGISAHQVIKTLQKHYQISSEQFAADCAISADSDQEIPVFRLMIYARVLSISYEQLTSAIPQNI